MTFIQPSETRPAYSAPIDLVGADPADLIEPGESFEQHLEADQISRLVRGVGIGIVLEPALSILMALVLWSHTDTRQAAFWLVLVWGGAALRALLWQHFRRSDPAITRPKERSRAFVSAATASGALWASAIMFMWPAGSLIHQLFLAGTTLAAIGVAVVSLASYMSAAAMYVVVSASVFAWGFFWHGTGDAGTVVVGVAAIFALLLYQARYVNRLLKEQSRLRFDLVAAAEIGEAASRAKSQFIANMSHELRTPLNAILGFSELIRDESFGPIAEKRYTGYASDIHNSGKHLLDVINDILDLSKIEAGKMDLTEEHVDLAQIINSSINLVRDSADRAGVTLSTVLPDHSMGMLADERALKQILINLLSNAIKFTPLGGEVVTEVKLVPGGGLMLMLRDTGIGMAAEDIPRAMAPFGQVDGTLARKFEGTGLGLPLVKSLVERHGGEFRLQSELGVGTTATASFPAESIRPKGRPAAG